MQVESELQVWPTGTTDGVLRGRPLRKTTFVFDASRAETTEVFSLYTDRDGRTVGFSSVAIENPAFGRAFEWPPKKRSDEEQKAQLIQKFFQRFLSRYTIMDGSRSKDGLWIPSGNWVLGDDETDGYGTRHRTYVQEISGFTVETIVCSSQRGKSENEEKTSVVWLARSGDW